jgi:adenosylcobinamide amidohydrolase
MILPVAIQIDAEAVVIRAEYPLRAVSSAIVGGGMTETRAIVNLHVPKGFHCEESGGGLVFCDALRKRDG